MGVSLRDQLLAKGLVSKKDAQKVERELKQHRREEQGHRRSKSELEALARAAAKAESEARAEALRVQRLADAARREAAERPLRARNLVAANRVRRGSGQVFHFRDPDGKVARIEVSSGVAHQLRCGEMALARFDRGGTSEIVALPRRAAERLLEIAPEYVVCFVRDATGLSDPALAFPTRTWETSLRPHRATAADLERFRR